MPDQQGAFIVERRSRDASIVFNFLSRCAAYSVICTLILYGPAIILVAGVTGDLTDTDLVVTGAALFVAGIALAAFCHRGFWRQLGTRVFVFPDGIEHIRRGESVHYRWEDIQAYYGWGLCRDAMLYVEIDWHYRVIHRAGNQFEFSERFHSQEETPIGYYIENGLLQCHLPHLRKQFFDKHDTLVFGPFALQYDGLSYGRRFLPWSDAEYIWSEEGSVRVRKRGKTFNWCNVESRKVPNICLFVALAKERIELEEAKAS